jgi:hypothetical protein
VLLNSLSDRIHRQITKFAKASCGVDLASDFASDSASEKERGICDETQDNEVFLNSSSESESVRLEHVSSPRFETHDVCFPSFSIGSYAHAAYPDPPAGDTAVNLLLSALVLLCGLGSVVFAVSSVHRWNVAVLAIVFVAFTAWLRVEPASDATWIGSLASGAAIFHVFRSERRIAQFIAATAGGMLAALLAWILMSEGLPIMIAALLAALLPAIASFLAFRRSDFAPLALREEALLLIFVMGLVIAVSPQVLAGWNSALVLNREGMSNANQALSWWTMFLSAAAVMLGGLYSLWRHR